MVHVSGPAISVVLAAHDDERFIAEAIQSVLDQTFTDFELIIVNDGSKDQTEAAIRRFRDERLVALTQEHHDPSAALNAGIARARGTYVALFSGEHVCHPQRLERQYRYLTKFGESALFSWVDVIDD